MNYIPEPYQAEASLWLSKRRRAMLVAPAGSGKTLMAAAALDIVLRAKQRTEKVKVGWICNSREQREQGLAALAQFPSIAQWASVDVECQQAGRTWNHVALLIVDECHHAIAPEWMAQILTCEGALWGMTATPDNGDELRDDALLALFNREVFIVPRSAVANRVIVPEVRLLTATDPGLRPLMDAEIQKLCNERLRRSGYGPPVTDGEAFRQVAWQVCVSLGIVANKARTAEAVSVAQKHRDDHVLVLVNQVDHAKAVAEAIGAHAVAVYAAMGKKKRDAALAGFKAGNVGCIVATSLADEGLDTPVADTLILVSGGRSTTKTEQRTGRALRKHDGKTGAVIYDFEDSFHPLMKRHSLKRMELYRKLGYRIRGELT